MTESSFRGVLVPVATPFGDDLQPDRPAFVALCRWLLEQGIDGLAVFGTTSEANSLGIEERMALLEALVEEGIPPERLMPGTGACAFTDTARLTAHAVSLGCGGVLVLPPFYYKDVNDDGLAAAFSEVIERVGDRRLRLYLYHIPPVARVPVNPALVERLLRDYPHTVAGIKDSSGDWRNTERLLDAFPQLAIFPGSETFLLDALRRGGAGCITATGNTNPAGIRAVYAAWRDPQAEALQARATAYRETMQGWPLIPAVKAELARRFDYPGWRRVRPPLEPLDDAAAGSLFDALARIAEVRTGA